MIIRSSKTMDFSFKLTKDALIENTSWRPYVLSRRALYLALKNKKRSVKYIMKGLSFSTHINDISLVAAIAEGKTQRGKRYIQIGCKRFVGINRQRLIRWAMSYKSQSKGN